MERLALITATDVCLKLSDSQGEAAVIEFVQLLNNLAGRDAISSISKLILHEMTLTRATALKPLLESMFKKSVSDSEWFIDLFVEECNYLLENVVL